MLELFLKYVWFIAVQISKENEIRLYNATAIFANIKETLLELVDLSNYMYFKRQVNLKINRMDPSVNLVRLFCDKEKDMKHTFAQKPDPIFGKFKKFEITVQS